jgi:hypothetical protein
MRSILLLALFIVSGYFCNAQYYEPVKRIFGGIGASNFEIAKDEISHSIIIIDNIATSIGNKPIKTYSGDVLLGFRYNRNINLGAKASIVRYSEETSFLNDYSNKHSIDGLEYGGFVQFKFYRLKNHKGHELLAFYLPIEYVYTTLESEFRLEGDFNHPELTEDNVLIRKYESSGGSYGYGLGAELNISKKTNVTIQYTDYKDFLGKGRVSLALRMLF